MGPTRSQAPAIIVVACCSHSVDIHLFRSMMLVEGSARPDSITNQTTLSFSDGMRAHLKQPQCS